MRLIERSAVLEKLESVKRHLQMWDDTQTADKIMAGIHTASLIVKDASVIDAVPVVHGEWKETLASGLDGVRQWSWCCSECGYEPYYFHDVHTLNYCPSCGAKMDGRDET